jgi:hypothetical protein
MKCSSTELLGFWTFSFVLNSKNYKTFHKLVLFPISDERKKIPPLLDPLERANLIFLRDPTGVTEVSPF